MKLLFIYIYLSFLFPLEYAIIYEDNLYDPANSIANLYSNEVDDDFKLGTETFSKSYIETFNGETTADKIKNFILELKINYPELDYILILGDENSFPPIYNNSEIPSDDFFTTSNSINAPPTISIGRVPSSDINKVNTFVDKLTEFLLSPTIGEWRDKAILIADDENKSGENEACEINHTKNSDIIYDILSNFMDVKTFYGIEYESIMTSDGLEHIDLNQDIINEINQGFALINYIGHGDQKKLSAEKIISLEDLSDIAINDNKFGLWVVGTCKFGQYDNELCMAEELIADQDAAIGVISTVRAISSTYNTNFLTYLFNEYSNHFNTSEITRIGDIIKAAKDTSYENNSFYQGYVFHLFGDPALPIFSSKQSQDYNFPESITLINQNIIENDSNYDFSNISLHFNDQDTDTLIYGEPTNLCDGELSYTKPGNVIFKNNFTDISCFNIPLDAMNCNNCNLKMKLYHQNNMTYNGVSYLSEDIELINQIDESNLSDNEGPTILFKSENSILTDNSIIPYHSAIQIELSDYSGINIFDGIGHNLRYWVNNEFDSYEVNFSDFNYSDPCSGTGYANINLTNDYIGKQNLFFEAWDNLNNRNIDSIQIYIGNKDYEIYMIDKFINLPNPFTETTYFTYQVPNQNHLPINTSINIFNLDGKLINTIHSIGKDSFNTVLWDGKDLSGKLVSNGTYLVKIEVISSTGKKENKTHIISKIN